MIITRISLVLGVLKTEEFDRTIGEICRELGLSRSSHGGSHGIFISQRDIDMEGIGRFHQHVVEIVDDFDEVLWAIIGNDQQGSGVATKIPTSRRIDGRRMAIFRTLLDGTSTSSSERVFIQILQENVCIDFGNSASGQKVVFGEWIGIRRLQRRVERRASLHMT